MNDEQYRQYCCEELSEFSTTLCQQTEHLATQDPARELALAFDELAKSQERLYDTGPELVGRVFTTYPEMAPKLPRVLLWFFGGDCLHYMADEEIQQFQQLDDLRRAAQASGETFNPKEARAKLLNLQ